jgi:hypothetical protein
VRCRTANWFWLAQASTVRVHECRTLAVQFGDPLAIWRPWAPRASGQPLPTGYFMMEEMPDQTLLGAFLGDVMQR